MSYMLIVFMLNVIAMCVIMRSLYDATTIQHNDTKQGDIQI